jgi:hypothetical protein
LGYIAVWKVLEEVTIDFRKKGVTVPLEVMNDLKNAKTMTTVLKADPSRGETARKIEEYLGNVESYLISEGNKRFGVSYVDQWLKRADEARNTIDYEEKEKLGPGLPRQKNWIRIMPSPELSIEKLKELVAESKLTYNVQTDGYLLVHGEDKTVRDFVKILATKYKAKTEE